MRRQRGSRPPIKTRTSLIFIIPKGCSDRRRGAPDKLAIGYRSTFIRTKTSEETFPAPEKELCIDRRRKIFDRIRRGSRHILDRIFWKKARIADIAGPRSRHHQLRAAEETRPGQDQPEERHKQQGVEHPHDGMGPLARWLPFMWGPGAVAGSACCAAASRLR